MSLETKERILDAAERLFADQGFASTPLRQITAEAGVNLAAVNYHFGSKDALLSAVFERRVVPVNAERLRRLDAVEAAAREGNPLDPAEVIRALVLPAFQAAEGFGAQGAKFMQLVGRMHAETNQQLRRTFLTLFQPVSLRFLPVFAKLMPDLPEEEVCWRMHFVIGALAHVLVCTQLEEPLLGNLGRSEHLAESLVQFCAAGLASKSSEERVTECIAE